MPTSPTGPPPRALLGPMFGAFVTWQLLDEKEDLDLLRGTWVLVSAERDGKKLAEAEVEKTRITFDQGRFTFPDASGIDTNRKGTIEIDPGKTPKQMDSTRTTDGATGEVSLGIYELAGDDYKVCFAPPGKARPAAFVSGPATGVILQVWKRQKP